MNLATLSIDGIDTGVLEELKAGEVSEGKLIEFKSALPGRVDGEKVEFLADVSSFANASGGHIFYGIVEQGGAATEICGLPGIDLDAEILRLEATIRDGIEPRIPGVISRAIRAQNGEFVIVIRIPNSWIAPHMITFKQHSRFYSRNSAGKYALDVTELRAAFTLSESVGQRIREFRDLRIGKIIAHETPVPIARNAAFILHFAPFASMTRDRNRDLITEGATGRNLETFGGGYYNSWFNFDGVLASGGPGNSGVVDSYTQLYRDGRVEMVDVFDDEAQAEKYIRSTYLEQRVIGGTRSVLNYLSSVGIEPPIAILPTLVGVLGFRIPRSGPNFTWTVIDRDVLPVPEVLFAGPPQTVAGTLRPCFNAIWNACGFPASPNFDAAGEWQPRS